MAKLLVLDIGGTFVKHGVTGENGALLPHTVGQTPSMADGGAEDFLNALRGIIREAGDVSAACACIAGPFDFDRGVSLMKHKFQALYGRSLLPPFEEKGLPVAFLHDSTAFMLGECAEGALAGEENACCVMLGTGLGFSWVRDGRVCVDATQTPSLALWKTPYLDGIAEDYVSTRAIQRCYGQAVSVREIADAARGGDRRAEEAFLTAGRHLSRIMTEVVGRLGCRKLALGGQIAKSAELFRLELPVPWSVTKHPEDGALRGCCRYAALGRERCVQTVDLDFGRLKAGETA